MNGGRAGNPHVKGERRKRVEAVRDATEKVLAATNYPEAYMAFSQLGRAVSALDEQIASTAGTKA